MVRAARLPRVIPRIACACALGLGAVAVAQTAAFDANRAGAVATLIADQAKQVRAQLVSTDISFADDLRELEGHADQLRSRLGGGLGEDPTASLVKRVVDLALAANERAKLAGASAATLASLDALQAHAIELEGLYGIDVASSTPREPAPAIANADPCVERVRLVGVEFAFDSADLTPESAATLSVAASRLELCAAIAVTIDGYTDSSGPARLNRQLSQKRADVVQAFLVEHGIDAERLSARGPKS